MKKKFYLLIIFLLTVFSAWLAKTPYYYETRIRDFNPDIIFKDDIDVKQLDTLIMATPRSNITQSCGRIMREENQRERLIYDILDFEIYENGIYQRKKYYKQITDSIEEIDF